MPRTTYRKIHLGYYSKCEKCGYELKNNKISMKLHFKYSHPNDEFQHENKNRLLCAVCKKPGCLLH